MEGFNMEIDIKNKKLQKEIILKNKRIEELEKENEELNYKLESYMEELRDTTYELADTLEQLCELQKAIKLSNKLQELRLRLKNPLFWNSDKLIDSAINLLEETGKSFKE